MLVVLLQAQPFPVFQEVVKWWLMDFSLFLFKHAFVNYTMDGFLISFFYHIYLYPSEVVP